MSILFADYMIIENYRDGGQWRHYPADLSHALLTLDGLREAHKGRKLELFEYVTLAETYRVPVMFDTVLGEHVVVFGKHDRSWGKTVDVKYGSGVQILNAPIDNYEEV